MRWEDLRDDTDDGALFERAAVAMPDERGTGRAGLAAPGAGPIHAGDDSEAVAVEIHARSIINRVPGASAVPFRWTVNPYRGCSHACVYCLAGDTPVLMADGRTRSLSKIRVGDRIYGTRRVGKYRRYTPTTVLAHWATVERAYRVTLADGTTLIASGDHRFLTDRGWKYVTGAMAGHQRRPYLTTSNTLIGTGQYAAGPEQTDAYRRGYLCGIIRGDARLGADHYPRSGSRTDSVYRFRLALADDEALDRAATYLAHFGVRTERCDFSAETAERRPITAIRTSRRASFERLSELVEWPVAPSDDWRTGFLAGIFDAEGSCSQGVLRIFSTDSEVATAISLGLKRFDFHYTLEVPKPNMSVVRLTGGLSERLSFFHLTDPAISRKRRVDDVALKPDAQLGVVSVSDLGEERTLYDITTGTGDFLANGVVSHNCFARRSHEYLDLDSGRDFDTKIMVKVNAGELLRRELAHPRWNGQPIAMGTNTDPYQRAEGRYQLMPGIIAALRDFANPFSVLTKGRLILRDIDLIVEAAQVTDVSLAVSVGFTDDALWRSVEPGTPRPRSRLDVVRRFADRGVGCSVLMAPILPWLTDSPEQVEETVAAIAAAGATSVTPLVLHLRPGAREWYLAWLEREHPDLVPRYLKLYRNGAYAPKSYQNVVTARVREAARRHGLPRSGGSGEHRNGGARRGSEAAPEPAVEQTTLL
ncbi:DNA repair photolyase [Lipingzhangella halophila]|uniref:DNA repair photolyase n=1 Tax=Lipingzhangella halophila TaxID=1783352 RepID=A0A7W7RN45_9ACTN|nr:intein-containing Rv2578c family radical SAM protein [Lipingzhangella halophila]MBB4935016.1 DNA repair photolyase [Lipingzhangella halophila]